MSSLIRVRTIARSIRTSGLRPPPRRFGILLLAAILPAIAAVPALDDGAEDPADTITEAVDGATVDTRATASRAPSTPTTNEPGTTADSAGSAATAVEVPGAPGDAPAADRGEEPGAAVDAETAAEPAPAPAPVDAAPALPVTAAAGATGTDLHSADAARTVPLTEAAGAARTAPTIAPNVTVAVPTPVARAIPTIQPTVTVAPAPSADDEPTPAAGSATAGPRGPEGLATGQLAGARPSAAGAPAAPPEPADPTAGAAVAPFNLLGEAVQPGAFAQLTWYGTETFSSASIPSAVLVAHGSSPGPVICITAAIHGDELNGIETVRRIMHDLDPTRLSGTVIGVPIVNIQGFHRSSRYLPDRRDLNRYFPGNPNGSSASRIAYSLFYNVIVFCNALVDLHTGSFHRTNLPQVRANLNDPGALALTQGFGSTVILHSDGEGGTLRAAATRAGIPAVTFEAGAPMQVQEDAVRQTEQGIRTLLDTLGVYRQPGPRSAPAPAYYQSRWVRTDHGGILSGRVNLGTLVTEGDLLGTVIDPLTNQQQEIRSPLRGRVIGMALDQFVMPGYATFHIGIEAPVEEVIESTPAPDPEQEAAEVEQGFDQS